MRLPSLSPSGSPPNVVPLAADPAPTFRGRFPHLPLPACVAVCLVCAALVMLSVPAISQVSDRRAQAKALAQAKQVGLALKLFAGDNDGIYPCDGTPGVLHAPATANAAFAVLFPTYTTSEKIFGNPLSVYQTRMPDNVIDEPYTGHPVKTLEPGENVYAYMLGLTDASNPAFPFVVDGTDGTGHYVSDMTKRGGVWSGAEAIVIRLDNSGALEKLAGPADARYVPLGKLSAEIGGAPDDNLLDAAHLGKGVRLLEPAVPAGK